LQNVEQAKAQLKKQQENYYKLSRSAEKVQENFEKAVLDDSKTEDQIQKAQEKMVKLKIEAQEAGNHYRKHIEILNAAVKKMYAEYKEPFKVFDENEESRVAFTRNTIINLLKFFNSFYSNKETNILENPEDKFKEFDEKMGTTKVDSFKLATMGALEEVLKNQPLEEYLSFEAKKKADEEKDKPPSVFII